MWTMESLREHIEQKFADAELILSPFPHLTIARFFPDEIYAEIQRNNLFHLNEGVLWKDRKTMKSEKVVTPYDHRLQINFHKKDPYTASEEGRALWQKIADTFLLDHWFNELVRSKFPQYFAIRFGDSASEPDFWDETRKELFIQRHETGYYIGPHTDIPSRIFTCIFAFPAQSGFEAFGTELMRPKDRHVRCWGNGHYDFEQFETDRIAPYAPNNFLLFFKTRQSFHAVPTITDAVPEQRWGMQFQCYEPHGGMFRDLSNPALMETRLAAAPDRSHMVRKVLARFGI